VAATQVCNYCLALPQPPPPPPEKTAEALDAEKVQTLKERESWQLLLFYNEEVGTYTYPEVMLQEILKFSRERVPVYFDVKCGYVGWFFPIPWENTNLHQELVTPPLLTKDVADRMIANIYIFARKIRAIIRSFLGHNGLTLNLNDFHTSTFMRSVTEPLWFYNGTAPQNWDGDVSALFLQMFEFIACLGRHSEGFIILSSILKMIVNGKLVVSNLTHVKLWDVALFQDDAWVKPDTNSPLYENAIPLMSTICETRLTKFRPIEIPLYSIIFDEIIQA
jgi:hypothetical protein